jgi:hypothetical protein
MIELRPNVLYSRADLLRLFEGSGVDVEGQGQDPIRRNEGGGGTMIEPESKGLCLADRLAGDLEQANASYRTVSRVLREFPLRAGFVYFLRRRASNSKTWKIGFSKWPLERLRTINSYYSDFVLVFAICAREPVTLERAIQNVLTPYRRKGEYFTVAPSTLVGHMGRVLDGYRREFEVFLDPQDLLPASAVPNRYDRCLLDYSDSTIAWTRAAVAEALRSQG